MSVGAVSGQSGSLQEHLQSLREGTSRQTERLGSSADGGGSAAASSVAPQVTVAGADALRQLRDTLLSLLGESPAEETAGPGTSSEAGLEAVLEQRGIDPQQIRQDLAAAKNGPVPATPGGSMPSLPPGLVFDATACSRSLTRIAATRGGAECRSLDRAGYGFTTVL